MASETKAQDAVFGTAELLEQILLHLSIRQLFAVQRVSQIFQSNIAGSKQLQRKMFLVHQDSSDERAPILNPLLKVALPVLSCVAIEAKLSDSSRPKHVFLSAEVIRKITMHDRTTLEHSGEQSWRGTKLLLRPMGRVVCIISRKNGCEAFTSGDTQHFVTLGELADWLAALTVGRNIAGL